MFQDLIGNADAGRLLGRLVKNGRIANALLFCGPESVGKRQFAIELARAFVCQSPVGSEACGNCSACNRAGKFEIPVPDTKNKDDFKRVFFSQHPDVGLVVPYNRNILVGAIRDLEYEANFRPYETSVRFFIIDEADKMNDAASNALLKTLEEPSPTSHLILVTSRPDALLQTVLSRCQTIRFEPVPVEAIELYLMNSLAMNGDDARLAARAAAGSIGRAIGTDVEGLRQRRSLMIEVLRSILETRDRAALLKISDVLSDVENRSVFDENMALLQTLIHDVWMLNLGAGHDRLMHPDLASEHARFAEMADERDLRSWLLEIEAVCQQAEVNVNRRIAADALFMKMSA
ncbi:MAG: DNA polymerase III subunit [Acidobacteriota bacterium]